MPKILLERPISDLEGKNSKFRFLQFLCIAPKNISVRYQPYPIKTVGGVWKSMKKWPKTTSLSPQPVEQKIGQPRNLCPDTTFSKIQLPYQFREDRTLGKWSKKLGGQTDTCTDICTYTSAYLRPQINEEKDHQVRGHTQLMPIFGSKCSVRLSQTSSSPPPKKRTLKNNCIHSRLIVSDF